MSEYADRNPMELEPYFMRHMVAMTAEGLHSKAAIAEELACRDKEIDRLRAELTAAQAVLQDPKRWMAWCDNKMLEDNEKLRAEVASLRALATCGCGDEFTVAEPGTCVNCMMKTRPCSWAEDGEGNWETQCGDMHILNEGGPTDNDMKFCCYCGGSLVEVRDDDNE